MFFADHTCTQSSWRLTSANGKWEIKHFRDKVDIWVTLSKTVQTVNRSEKSINTTVYSFGGLAGGIARGFY